MIGYGQKIIDDLRKEQYLAEWKKTSTTSTTTIAPPVVFEDEADLSVTNNISNESKDASLDQSNHGFSFVNIQWASFSTGLSSVLAVIVALVMVAGCCYFRGRCQRQSHACHTEVLCSIVAGANLNVSSHPRSQSGAYPGSSSPGSAQASSGAPVYLVVAYLTSPPAASCVLPGCTTTYSKPASISSDSTGRASHLPLGFDSATHAIAIVNRRPTAPPAIEYLPHDTAVRQTGIQCLSS